MNENRFRTCAHEAGHAVAGLHFGAVIRFASVSKRREIAGDDHWPAVVMFKHIPSKFELHMLAAGELAADLIVDRRGGYMSESYLRAVLDHDCALGHGHPETDHGKIMLALGQRCRNPVLAYRRIESAVWSLLDHRSHEVRAIASALYGQGRLSGQDIADVLGLAVQDARPRSRREDVAYA